MINVPFKVGTINRSPVVRCNSFPLYPPAPVGPLNLRVSDHGARCQGCQLSFDVSGEERCMFDHMFDRLKGLMSNNQKSLLTLDNADDSVTFERNRKS